MAYSAWPSTLADHDVVDRAEVFAVGVVDVRALHGAWRGWCRGSVAVSGMSSSGSGGSCCPATPGPAGLFLGPSPRFRAACSGTFARLASWIRRGKHVAASRIAMKIAQIAPLAESVPPRLYGGTERIVSYLTEELVAQGHDVTLFASGDSETARPAGPLRPDRAAPQPGGARPAAAPPADARAGPPARAASSTSCTSTSTSCSSRCCAPSPPRRSPRCTAGSTCPTSCPSTAPSPRCRWSRSPTTSARRCRRSTGCAPSTTACRATSTASARAPAGGYLAFLGRISPEKRPDRAIEIATRAGMPLRIAAKVDNADARLLAATRSSRSSGRTRSSSTWARSASARRPSSSATPRALLFPIDWPEPFGLVMIEAMACGTPVIAFACGSTPEVVDHGESGFLVDIGRGGDRRRPARRPARPGAGARGLRATFLHRAGGRRLPGGLSVAVRPGRPLRPTGDLSLTA